MKRMRHMNHYSDIEEDYNANDDIEENCQH